MYLINIIFCNNILIDEVSELQQTLHKINMHMMNKKNIYPHK